MKYEKLRALEIKRDATIHAGFFSTYGYVHGASFLSPAEQLEGVKHEFDVLMKRIKAIDKEYEEISNG